MFEHCAALATTYLHLNAEFSKLQAERYQKKEGLLMLDSLYKTFSFGHFMRNVEARCAAFFKTERATFLVCDEQRRELYRRVAHHHSHDTLQSFACDQGIAGYVASSGTPTAVSGVESDSRFVPAIDDPLSLKSGASPAREILAVPIVLSGEQTSQQYIDLPKAVLILINRVDCAPFSQEDNEYLCSYAPLIGRALDVVQ